MSPNSPLDPRLLPRPHVSVTPERAAYPVEGGTLDVLVDVAVAFPPTAVDRRPLALALVIDRSGSMAGAPLEGAKLAAEAAVGMLLPDDWVSVVAYDSAVTVVSPLGRVGSDRRALIAAIRRVTPGATTALHAGWVEGVTQANACPVPGALQRVVLLTDGLANVGVTEPGAIALDVAGAARLGISTSAYGLGATYDEVLLRALGDAGSGNYAYIEHPGQIAELFQQEVAGVSALRGRAVRLRALAHGAVLCAATPRGLTDERGLVLPDLVAGLPLEVLATVTLEAGAPAPRLALEWDDVFTGARETIEVRVPVEGKPSAEVARLPVAARIEALRRALEIAAEQERVAEALRRDDLEAAEAGLRASALYVSLMPPGEERDREERRVQRVRASVLRGDRDVAAKMAHQDSYDRTRSIDTDKRQALLRQERLWRREKEARAGERRGRFVSRAGAAPAPLVELRLVRGDGGEATVQVVVGDLTDEAVEAIVNSTNRGLFGTQGVDGAIHRRGGPRLTAAARAIGTLGFGEAVFTDGFDLPARYVIHTATTPWGSGSDDTATLRRCYASAFTVAERLDVRSVALPAIGTGTYAYPVEVAVPVAVESALQWLRGRGRADLLRFVVVDAAIAEAYRRELGVAT
jgi:Ca-activated chloride channel homolog